MFYLTLGVKLKHCDMKSLKAIFILLVLVSFHANLVLAQDNIYLGNTVPEGWNGSWPEKFTTACEKSGFEYTASNDDILEYFAMLKWNSEYVHVFDMFTSDRGRNCPVLVMANPRVTNAEEARKSGKTVVYLQGGIHPGECEGKEAELMLIRDILFGDKTYLLDNLIILVCPNFNVDGNETRSVSGGLPMLSGTRQNAYSYDVNRDAIKLETTNMKGAYMNLFNKWDPVIIYDTHRMGSVRHGYPIVYAGSNVATAHQAPRDYVTYKIFPALTEEARKDGKIEIFYHCGLTRDVWPPTEYTHDNAIWSTEGKFMVSGYGLRNRMAILVETVGYVSFEKKVYSQYVCADELLKYCYKNGNEMTRICREADEDVVKNIIEKAESGTLKNFVEGKYVSEGKFDILGYKEIEYEYIPGTSIRQVVPESINRKPEVIKGIDLVTKPVGVKEATVPRGYLIPADLKFLVDKLRILGLEVTELEKPVTAKGEEFVINNLSHVQSGGYNMTLLDGDFIQVAEKEIPAGTYILDMAQPLANVAFYALEPQVGDGFIGWNLLDDYFESLGVKERAIVYPVYKYFRINL